MTGQTILALASEGVAGYRCEVGVSTLLDLVSMAWYPAPMTFQKECGTGFHGVVGYQKSSNLSAFVVENNGVDRSVELDPPAERVDQVEIVPAGQRAVEQRGAEHFGHQSTGNLAVDPTTNRI